MDYKARLEISDSASFDKELAAPSKTVSAPFYSPCPSSSFWDFSGCVQGVQLSCKLVFQGKKRTFWFLHRHLKIIGDGDWFVIIINASAFQPR